MWLRQKPLNLELKLEVASSERRDRRERHRAHFGEAEAINQTRTADNLIDVLPSKVITSLPNANVADALGRLPGVVLERIEGEGVYVDIRGLEPRLTNTTIDGITVPAPEPDMRQIRLDVINSDLVEAVEINKTLSARQDGDGIAWLSESAHQDGDRPAAVQCLCQRRLHANPQWPRGGSVWRHLRDNASASKRSSASSSAAPMTTTAAASTTSSRPSIRYSTLAHAFL